MKLSIYSFAFTFLFLTSCGTQQVYYPAGSSEASITLPENNARLSILNRIQIGYTVPSNGGFFSPNIANGMNGALAGFRDEIANRRYFSVAGNISDYKDPADGNYSIELTKEQIQNVAQDADMVAVLAMFDQAYRDDYKVEIRREDLGGKVYKEVDYFIGIRTLYLKTGWRLYDARTGEMLDEFTLDREYSYESESLQRIRATQLLEGNFPRELENFGRRMGRDFASRVSPTNHYIYRSIYDKGNDWLLKGSLAVLQENWVEAEEEWQRGIKREKNRKKLAKLYHNLAMAAEKTGEIEKAKEYAKLAANMHPIGRQTQAVVGY